MFNLSTQEVVLSIEKTPVIKEKHFVYQHYYNFFGNLQELELDIDNLNFDRLENQENYHRKRLSYNEKLSKQLHIFFMNSKITNALIKKFNTDLRFKSVDIWTDNKGYYIPPHIDDSGIKLALQIYLSEDNIGTSLYNKDKKIKTFTFEPNSGYALLNTKNSFHGVDKIEKEGRISLYARYS
jgi:hypothetical protein